MSEVSFSILVLHGPNLQLLGTREPGIYGTTTLAEIDAELQSCAQSLGVSLASYQSNHEGDLVDRVGRARGEVDGLLINAAAYTHTSVALLDALRAVALPCVEVHLTHPAARESFRHVSHIAGACIGQVSGFGPASYLLALRGLVEHLKHHR